MKYELIQVGMGIFGVVSRSIKKSDNKGELEDHCNNVLKVPITRMEDVFINTDAYPLP